MTTPTPRDSYHEGRSPHRDERSYGSAEGRTKAKQAGFDESMVKPVDLDQSRDWRRDRPLG